MTRSRFRTALLARRSATATVRLELLEPRQMLTADCIDFDDLAVGTAYHVSDTFVADDTGLSAKIEGQAFTFSGGGTTSGGQASVESSSMAGGSGLELAVNNILLSFNFVVATPLSGLKLNFGEFGGNLNLEVNGDFRNFEDFQDIAGLTIGGANIQVPLGGTGGDRGVLVIDGAISSLKIGGQELWIDQICLLANESEPTVRLDWGDAPDKPYPTLSASNGARHVVRPKVHLGRRVDAEPDGQPSPLANRDDANPSLLADDEDGVTFVTTLVPGGTATVEVTASIDGWLNAWIDFDADGVWSGADEYIFQGEPLSAGLNSLSFNVPATAVPSVNGPTFSRWRFSTTHKELTPQGGAPRGTDPAIPDGEVEDHLVRIRPRQPEENIDYGDAPDRPYPTLFGSDGARHRIVRGFYLGKQVDDDPDGQPTLDADGDDNADGNDDEDGVEFLTKLIPGQDARIRVVASEDGRLDAWIDYDRNGVWDPYEQIAASTPLVAGENFLSVSVPRWAVPSERPTYSRFRLSRQGGLIPTGLASDGEVEDYAVSIEERDPQGPSTPVVKLSESSLTTLSGSIQFPEPTLIPLADGGERWIQMISPGSESVLGQLGMPAVPVHRQLVAVPAGAEIAVKLVGRPEGTLLEGINLYPFQETALDADDPTQPPASLFDDPPGFQKNLAAYGSKDTFPDELVRITPLGKMRDLEVALLEVATGQYNPSTQELTILNGVDWEVSFRGGKGFLPESALNPFENAAGMYAGVINAGIIDQFVYPGDLTINLGEELLILTHPDFREAADKLAVWKRQKGIMTNVFEVGEGTARDTKEEIKDLIQSRWDNNTVRPSYLLLLGDSEFIPTYYRSTHYAGGPGGPEIKKNQDSGNGSWVTLGTAHFRDISGEYVDLVRLPRDDDITDLGATVADAVRFANTETGETVIVDNQDAGFSIVDGNWYESAAVDEFDGSSLFTFDENARVRFDPSLPREGLYEVSAWWSRETSTGSNFNRDSSASYRIASANTGTDTPYTLVAGGFLNILPDLANGRIPVDTADQAMTVVDKIIDYEKTPPGSIFDSSFYQNATVASHFQGYRDGSPTGRDNRAFVEESERARNTLIGAGKTVERIYVKTEDAGESSQEPNRYYDGSLLPADLRIGSGFAWNGDTNDILDAFDDGRFLMVHRDHGWPGGWANPGFSTGNIPSLNNGDLTPVVYSINCASGLFDNETDGTLNGASTGSVYFAERLLREPDAGAVGVIGDTRNSNTWSNTAFLRGLVDATWQNNDSGFGGPASIHRLGDIMNYAKLYTVAQIGVEGSVPAVGAGFALDTINLYHVFGDPTLELWTSNPHVFPLLSEYQVFELNPDILTLNYKVAGAKITAFQLSDDGLVPLGRGVVPEDGMLELPLIHKADTTKEVFLSVCMDGAICQALLPARLGDFDDDNDVDSNDLGLFLSFWTGFLEPGQGTQTAETGDFDGDGDSDSNDLGLFISYWTGALDLPPLEAASAVPALAGPTLASPEVAAATDSLFADLGDTSAMVEAPRTLRSSSRGLLWVS